MSVRRFNVLLFFLALFLLQSCGGGGEDSPNTPPVTVLNWDSGTWDQLNWQ